jgi:hypothetical protein
METRLAGSVRAMRLVIYAALMAVLTPLLLSGLVFYLVPIVASGGRVSGTAYAPFITRLFYHLVGSRPDHAALALARGLPATNRVVMVLLMKPFVWAARLSGIFRLGSSIPLNDRRRSSRRSQPGASSWTRRCSRRPRMEHRSFSSAPAGTRGRTGC